MMAVVQSLGLPNPLKYELAGMLSQIGMVAVPDEIVFKRFRGEKLTPEEDQIYRMHATVAATLLSQIPRMNEVVQIISCQRECFVEESQMPEDAILINLCLEYDDLDQLGVAKESAVETLRLQWEAKAPAIFAGFEKTLFSDEGFLPKQVPLKDIRAGMILRQDLFDEHGTLIMAKGQELSAIAILRIAKMRETFKMPNTISVLVPLQQA
jgi:hypothetical protein